MIKIEKTKVVGFEEAIRGMRNPMNSWERSDSSFYVSNKEFFVTGPNDYDLMMKLAEGGAVHAKYRRMIAVYVDITAPLYWWKEFDTYKVGTVANSCSTMHKIHAKEFEIEDFSTEHLNECNKEFFKTLVCLLNTYRNKYIEYHDKTYWWQMIQLLPSSYNQKRTVMLNYEVLVNIYKSRLNHKLDEWHEFCKWIQGLPYSEVITCDKKYE